MRCSIKSFTGLQIHLAQTGTQITEEEYIHIGIFLPGFVAYKLDQRLSEALSMSIAGFGVPRFFHSTLRDVCDILQVPSPALYWVPMS